MLYRISCICNHTHYRDFNRHCSLSSVGCHLYRIADFHYHVSALDYRHTALFRNGVYAGMDIFDIKILLLYYTI